ncbi:low molecular weight protein-tyrosine-phosphatase [Halomonas sp. WWR20]
MIRVLFVCLGNICRSPTAEGVLRERVVEAGLSGLVEIDSCGTGNWHVGEAPDERAVAAAAKRDVSIEALRARQLSTADFSRFDYLLAMDSDNLAYIRSRCPDACQAHVGLFLDFAGYRDKGVPDPYYSGEAGFDLVLDLIEEAADGLIAELRQKLAHEDVHADR